MKQIFPILLLLLFFTSCGAVKSVHYELINSENRDRTNEIVEIPVSDFAEKLKLNTGEHYELRNAKNEIITSQLTHDGKLIFQTDLAANEQSWVKIEKSTNSNASAPESSVFGRVYPERKDDFAWENDRIGFRFYGDALKIHDGPSNGLDLWYKRTNKLILNEWYRKSVEEGISYHVDHGEGCDPYAVGHSLGGGAMAPFIDGELILNDNYLTAEILDEGPLRFTAILHYPELEIKGKTYRESRTVSLDAGAQLTKITQNYHTNDLLPVAAGIVKRASGDSLVVSQNSNYFIYTEPHNQTNGQIFLTILMPQGIDSVATHAYEYLHPVSSRTQHFSHTLALTTTQAGTATYYTGFGWSKFGYETNDAFQEYIENYINSLKNPLLTGRKKTSYSSNKKSTH